MPHLFLKNLQSVLRLLTGGLQRTPRNAECDKPPQLASSQHAICSCGAQVACPCARCPMCTYLSQGDDIKPVCLAMLLFFFFFSNLEHVGKRLLGLSFSFDLCYGGALVSALNREF